MTLQEAVQVLKLHNEWRRDRNFDAILAMQNPTEIGQAIDIAVAELEKVID